MENIKFEITNHDIREYLKQHKKDESIKYREAMFVKYMKKRGILTCEALEILMKKYNWENESIHGIYHYDNLGILHKESLPNFDSYLSEIHNLDMSGICHIMIPILSYYSAGKNHCFSLYRELSDLVRKMKFESNENIDVIEKDTYENYNIAYSRDIFKFVGSTDICFSKEKSGKIIHEYASIYGEEPVKQIRKIIRERM